MPEDKKQLADLTIIVSVVAHTDEGKPYAQSFVLRGDLEFDPEGGYRALGMMMEKVPQIAHLAPAHAE